MHCEVEYILIAFLEDSVVGMTLFDLLYSDYVYDLVGQSLISSISLGSVSCVIIAVRKTVDQL